MSVAQAKAARAADGDVIGRVPSVEELDAFTKNRASTKRADLVFGYEYLAYCCDEIIDQVKNKK